MTGLIRLGMISGVGEHAGVEQARQPDTAAGASRVVQAYRFALAPTPEQERALASHCGAQRFAFNWALRRVTANVAQREAERSYGVTEKQLTPAVSWSAYALRKDWNAVKNDVAPWWAENSKEAYASGIANLATALSNWQASHTGARAGKPVGFPTRRTRRGAWSCRFTTGAFGLADSDRRHVKLPRIGTVRTHESTRKLARHVERGTARIRSATVSWRQGRWWVSFSVEIERDDPGPAEPEAVVGVDLGVRHLAVLSTGEVIPNPKPLQHALRELRRLQRRAARQQGPDARTGQPPSQRWRATQARIARLHARIADLRREALHQFTTWLVARFGTIVLEDLHVLGLLSNRKLARAIADVGWGELRRQITYKTGWRGSQLIVANRWYPSSKTCSGCDATKAKLRLSERTFTCTACGLSLDRDLNAARNLARLADEAAVAPSSQSRGATRNEPAGTPHPPCTQDTGDRHGKTPVTTGVNAA